MSEQKTENSDSETPPKAIQDTASVPPHRWPWIGCIAATIAWIVMVYLIWNPKAICLLILLAVFWFPVFLPNENRKRIQHIRVDEKGISGITEKSRTVDIRWDEISNVAIYHPPEQTVPEFIWIRAPGKEINLNLIAKNFPEAAAVSDLIDYYISKHNILHKRLAYSYGKKYSEPDPFADVH